jgi:uncharacterized protein YjbI with pentapeptide repeats
MLLVFFSFRSQQEATAWQILESKPCGRGGMAKAIEIIHSRDRDLSEIDFSWTGDCGQEVVMRRVTLRRSSFYDSTLERLDFGEAKLRRTDIRDAELTSVDFTLANLDDADFGRTELLDVR